MTSSKPQWWRPFSEEPTWQAQARKTTAALDKETFLTWLDGNGAEASKLSFGGVWGRSEFLAKWLLGDVGLAAGDRALLVYAPGPEFFVAFIGCLRAGVFAVPSYPPDPANLRRGLEKLDLVSTSCSAEVGLTDNVVHKLRVTTSIWHAWPRMRWHNTENLGQGDDDASSPLFHRLARSQTDAFRSTTLYRRFFSSGESAPRPRAGSMPAVGQVSTSSNFDEATGQPVLDGKHHDVARKSLVAAHGEQQESFAIDQAPPDSIAFLQFTSGSTGCVRALSFKFLRLTSSDLPLRLRRDPKGVMVAHSNIWHNLNEIYFAWYRHMAEIQFGKPEADRYYDLAYPSLRVIYVSWVPQFHDMGLMLMFVGPFLAGYHMVNFSPLSFLANPLMWMRAVSKYRALGTSAPDFAYHLSTKRAASADDISDIDLSSLVNMGFGCGQRCVPSVIREFDAFFSMNCKLPDDKKFVPTYGLAEHVERTSVLPRSCGGDTCCATRVDVATCCDLDGLVTSRQRPDLASCGSEFVIDVHIVDAETRRVVPESTTGELWVGSGSVTLGYWGKPELSDDVFCARLDPDDGKTYLRTGDE
ncbi:hypothetical protein CTAYLR_005399, partial [Chrysophaeum taylorii]